MRGLQPKRQVVVIAPTSAAVAELRKHGFPATATVQRFLASERFQRTSARKVLIVDEAGLLSTRDMVELLEIAKTRQCRVILAGDTRQHASVEAGDALRLLENRSALRVAQVTLVRRQVSLEYREAIADLAAGRGPEGLERLRRLGAVREMPHEERYPEMAREYGLSIRQGKTALIVSPTWREIGQVNGAVRQELKKLGHLDAGDAEVTSYRSLKWTRAQKRDLRLYSVGLGLHFHKPTAHTVAGETLVVSQIGDDFIEASHADGRKLRLTGKQAGCFDVAEPIRLAISAGERLLLLGTDKKHGLYNGQIVTAQRVDTEGVIHLVDGRTLPRSFRQFAHGYCVTSYASQGRTVDHVYVAVDSHNVNAANLNQLYVSCSRGREQVRVYTDDVGFLSAAVTKRADRLSATELIEGHPVKPAVRNVPRTKLAT